MLSLSAWHLVVNLWSSWAAAALAASKQVDQHTILLQVELRCPSLHTCNLGAGANSKLKQMHLSSRSLRAICWQGFQALSDVHIACPSLTSVSSAHQHHHSFGTVHALSALFTQLFSMQYTLQDFGHLQLCKPRPDSLAQQAPSP